jgi:hypothetical protein
MAINIEGFESLSITDTAGNLSPPNTARSFYGYLETADVRMRSDGTASTSSVGVFVPQSSWVGLDGTEEMNSTSFIRDASTNATLQGHFYSVTLAEVIGPMII